MDPKVKLNKLEEGEKGTNVPYREVLRSMMYIMVGTRPDLCYVISALSYFMSNPGPAEHWAALKTILRYIKDAVTILA